MTTLEALGAAPRALLQLVPDRHARAAAAGLHLDGRQRQHARAAWWRCGAGCARRRASRSSRPSAAQGLARRGRAGARVAPRGEVRSVAPKGYAAMEADACSTIGRQARRRRRPTSPAGTSGSARSSGTATEAHRPSPRHARRRRRPGRRPRVPWLRGVRGDASASTGADLAVLRGDESAAPASLARPRPARPGGGRPAGADPPGSSDRAGVFIKEMDFAFLYKDDRHLFSIGANLAQDRLDASCYDLLASESASDELPGRRPGRGAAAALVPARPAVHQGRRPDRPALVGRDDVRVPHAPPADAHAARHAHRPDDPRDRGAADRVRPAERACPGGSPSRASRRSIPTATTSTSRSACRAWG